MSDDIRNAGNAASSLLDPNSFSSAGKIDSHVPAEYGLYAIRLRQDAELPEPFGAIRRQRDTDLVYLGEAQRQTLRVRLLGNELRAKGNGTFFRSLDAVSAALDEAIVLMGAGTFPQAKSRRPELQRLAPRKVTVCLLPSSPARLARTAWRPRSANGS